jgi:hypothetical protein
MVSTWAYIALCIGLLIVLSLIGSYTRIQSAKYIGSTASTAQIDRYYEMKTFGNIIGVVALVYFVYFVYNNKF